MNADLLRRAATLIRDRATEANVRPGEDWESTWYMAPGYEARVDWSGDPQMAGVAVVIVGTSAGPYLEVMQPTVGLALADLLADAADDLEQSDGVVDTSSTELVLAVARAILREVA